MVFKIKKKNLPTYLPMIRNMSRITAKIQFIKDGLSENQLEREYSHNSGQGNNQ
jgi:hypothetical protein